MTELVGIARFQFNEGKLEEFKRLSGQAMSCSDQGAPERRVDGGQRIARCIIRHYAKRVPHRAGPWLTCGFSCRGGRI